MCTETWSNTPERARLEAIAETNDGFQLAEIDVRTRKHGDVLGEGQSGLTAGLGLLNLGEDVRVIERARKDAAKLAASDPDFARRLTYDITDEEAVWNMLMAPITVIDGNEIMELFHLKPSREVGELKKALKEAVLENIVPNEREPLLALLREKAKELGVG